MDAVIRWTERIAVTRAISGSARTGWNAVLVKVDHSDSNWYPTHESDTMKELAECGKVLNAVK